LGLLGLGLFCAKGLWFFDVFALNWSRGENSKFKMENAKLRKPDVVGRENSKFQISNAKLRNPDVVGMGVFIAGGRQKVDLWGRGLFDLLLTIFD